MTKSQLNRKADQLISLGVRLEHIVAQLPPELRDVGNLKSELGRLISRVTHAAQ